MSEPNTYRLKVLMSRIDNYDQDMADDDQPGPSGMNTHSHKIIITQPSVDTGIEDQDHQPGPSGMIVQKDQKQETVAAIIEEQCCADLAGKKDEDAVLMFSQKVTIAGLEEAFNNHFFPDRSMFQISLILAFAMIAYQAYNIALKYERRATVFIDQQIEKTAPFPNVSVCFPVSTNSTVILEDIVLSESLEKKMYENNYSRKDILQFYAKLYLFDDVTASTYESFFYRSIFSKFLSEVDMQPSWRNHTGVNDREFFTCHRFLSNCTFKGRNFECCQYARLLFLWQYNCFEINVESLEKHLTLTDEDNGRDATDLHKIGLSFHVSTDWDMGFFDEKGSASDGYHIFIGKLPNQFQIPVAVPAGMDAVVTLAQPREMHETSSCYLNPPALKFNNYYDSNGVNCQFDLLQNPAAKYLGCEFTGLSYIPDENKMCSRLQNNIFSMVVSGSLRFVASEMEDVAKTFVESVAKNSICLPLCSRWVYPVLSASYNSISYQNRSRQEEEYVHKSWNRLNVIMPHSVSMDHTEKRVSVWYTTMCQIGGMMGAYAGFSMVTFPQVLAYGLYAIWWKWKQKKKNAIGVAPAQATSVQETSL